MWNVRNSEGMFSLPRAVSYALSGDLRDNAVEALYARWNASRSVYDYQFTTYVQQVCEEEILPVLRKILLLDDLSRV